MAKKNEELSFETAFQELEETVRRLEAGGLSLEEALALYERGQELAALCDEHDVTFRHVPGHAGHPENEECDRMAVEESRRLA